MVAGELRSRAAPRGVGTAGYGSALILANIDPWVATLEAVRDQSEPRYNLFDLETWHECDVLRTEVEGLLKGR